MEALAAVKLAGNDALFVEYAITLVSKTPQILNKSNHMSKEISEIESVIDGVELALRDIYLLDSISRNGARPDEILDDLTRRCVMLSSEISTIIKNLSLKLYENGPARFSETPNLDELSKKLYDLREPVSAHLIVLLRQQKEELDITLRTFTTASKKFQDKTASGLQKVIDYLHKITTQASAEQARNHGVNDKSSKSGQFNTGKAQQTATSKPPPLQLHLVRSYFDDFVRDMENWAKQKETFIRESLYCSQLDEREFAIAKARKDTLKWIFRQESRTGFVQWLREGNGIYWIAGDAGSGKSTLMKFLTGHQRTVHHLSAWAGDRTLVIAEHYFWSSGTLIQKSQSGLFRALLFQILCKLPELVQVVCQKRWKARYAESVNPWSCAELVETLEAIGTIREADFRVCLFIDGLDEHAGDNGELVRVIQAIGKLGNFKICASSRPWAGFSRAFGDSPLKLYLQDFTFNDIRQIVQDNLLKYPFFSELLQRDGSAVVLTSEITRRANGIFLWALWVVHSMLPGLGLEGTVEELQRQLREFPTDLSGLFNQMLESIHPVYEARAARLLLTMSYAQTKFPVITLSFMDFGDGSFSDTPPVFLKDWPKVNRARVETLSENKNELVALCGDLISITPDPKAPILFDERVGFVHRAVPDSLFTANTEKELLRRAGEGFSPTKVLLEANIGQLQSMMHLYRLDNIKPYLEQAILGSLYYAHELEVVEGHAEIEALDKLDAIITRAFKGWDFADVMERMFEMPGITSFLALVCKCDMALYVVDKHPNYTERKLDVLAPGWRQPFRIQRGSSFEICPWEPGMDETYEDWRVGRSLGLLPPTPGNKEKATSDQLDDTIRSSNAGKAVEMQKPSTSRRGGGKSKILGAFKVWRS